MEEDYKLERIEDTEIEPIEQIHNKVNLSEDQKYKMMRVIEEHLSNIEQQRAKDNSEQRWQEYENQYWGIVRDNPDTIFNSHVFLTLKHVRMVKNRTYQAFFESDPIFSVSARPGSGSKGIDQAELQEQLLDYEFDSEIIIKKPMGKIFHQSILLDGGVAKIVWDRTTEWKKYRETYKGTKTDLQKFKDNYPEGYPEFVRMLENGQDIEIMAQKEETIYDAPRVYFVNFADFYIDLTTNGLQDLRRAPFFAEKQQYKYHELQQEVNEDNFDRQAVEELKWIVRDGKAEVDPYYLTKSHEVFETHLIYDVNDNNKPRRIIVWYSREHHRILACEEFPYEHGRPIYIPFFLTDERPGWHQPGLGRILKPQNIIANAITNFILDNGFHQNVPLLRANPNAPVAGQLMAKTWKIGDPLIAEKGEIEKFDMRGGGMGDLMNLATMNQKLADDTSGVSSPYMTGRADPTDPDAPAKKTMALLRESNINVRAYILSLLPSFQEMAYQILQLFAQFKESIDFKSKKVLGQEKRPFKNVSRNALRLRTNVTPNAQSFTFDKVKQKKENLALVQFLTSNPLSAEFLKNAPQARWNLFNILIKNWDDFWAQKVTEVWPTKEQFEEYMKEMQEEAFEEFYQRKVQEAVGKAQGRPTGGMPPTQPAPARPAGPAGGAPMPRR